MSLRVVTIRASALADFLDCPARAEAKHLLGKKCPQSPGALLGTALHRSTAAFDSSRLNGAQGLTVRDSAGAAVDAIHKPTEDVVYADEDSSRGFSKPQEVEDVALALHARYCLEIAPTQHYAAVEVKCERLEITDIGLALTGTTDRVRQVASGHGISDLKSGQTAVKADGTVETKGHRYQIGVYELLAEKASGLPITQGGEVIGLQAGKTAKGQRVARSAPIHGARDVLLGEPDSPGILEIIAHQIHAGIFPGNPRSILCHEKYCPIYNTCKFRK
jgi:hypothetical protein